MWIDKVWPKILNKNGNVLSAHTSAGWVGQYERMIRFYIRCQEAQNTEDYLDFTYAFFQNCYHLREWIKHNNVIDDFDSSWSKFTNQFEVIKYCRDICNGTKHNIISSPSKDKDFYLLREYDPTEKNNEIWYVTFKEESIKIEDLMTLCLQAWDSFIAENNLIKNNN